MRTRERQLFFLQKTIELSYWLGKISFRTAPPTKICCLHSQVIFLISKRFFVSFKIWLAARRLIAILSLAGPPRDPKARSARFKNSLCNVKLLSEVNCSKSSDICLICSSSSLKRLKDINKNVISTLWIITNVSQKIILQFHCTSVFLTCSACLFDFVGRREVHSRVY